MTKTSQEHRCSQCGAASAKWAGRCGACGEWNSLVAVPSSLLSRDITQAPTRLAPLDHPPVELSALSESEGYPTATGLPELDRVLSGGLVAGSVTLLGGEPGIGKSTLVLQAAAKAAEQGRRALVISAEESEGQVGRRARRLGTVLDGCFVLSTPDIVVAVEAAAQLAPDLLIIDSIQTVSDPASSSPAGSPNQVRECAQLIARFAKQTGTTSVLVGHVTKDGSLAGPRTLEHLVDTVLSFEGDRHHALRSLVATKHRFGAAGELGLFEMSDSGLRDVADPSRLLLADRRPGIAGSVAVPVIEGRRPLLVEVQALLAESRSPSPRRVVQGVSSPRASLVVAVLEQALGAPIGASDLFVSTVGGVRVAEPAADLAIAMALVSAATGVALPDDAVCFGEIGLSGEIRQAQRPERRLAEAARLGFRRAVTPFGAPDAAGIAVHGVPTVVAALQVVGLPIRMAGSAAQRAAEGAGDRRRIRQDVLVG